MARDPVCRMEVNEKEAAATSVYKGQTYYFCHTSCKEKFDKEPELYLYGTEYQRICDPLRERREGFRSP